jgi:hypothetical protein
MIRYADGSIRYFTVFEAKRLQTFPDNYKITGSWGEALRQIGNAVPVLLGEHLGRMAMELLKKEERFKSASIASIFNIDSSITGDFSLPQSQLKVAGA